MDKKLFSQKLREYLKMRDKTQADLVKYIGVSSATVSDWCNGKKMPRTDKIVSICNWLGIEMSDLLNDSEPPKEELPYYLDDDAKELAQLLHDSPEHRVLFDAVRKIRPEDIQFVKDMIDRIGRED